MPLNLRHVWAVLFSRPGFFVSRGRPEEMVDVVVNGLLLLWCPAVVGDTGSTSSSGDPQGLCAAAPGEGLCRTGAMDPAGVEGGVWLPEDSAETSTWTSVVTVP